MLDREDVVECQKLGKIEEADLALISTAERCILDTWQDLVGEIDQVLEN